MDTILLTIGIVGTLLMLGLMVWRARQRRVETSVWLTRPMRLGDRCKAPGGHLIGRHEPGVDHHIRLPDGSFSRVFIDSRTDDPQLVQQMLDACKVEAERLRAAGHVVRD